MIGNDWDIVLKDEFDKQYFKELNIFLENERILNNVFPPKKDTFRAFELCSFSNTKVVILGQDPYFNKNQAMGLCFCVNENVKEPASLKNIKKEILNDVGSSNLDFVRLARDGVLFLNTILTVCEGKPGSHKNKGWEIFTDKVIKILNKKNSPVVFLLWGNFAISKKDLIGNPIHLILTAAHPSPLSAYKGFLGCKHFSKANEFLGDDKITW